MTLLTICSLRLVKIIIHLVAAYFESFNIVLQGFGETQSELCIRFDPMHVGYLVLLLRFMSGLESTEIIVLRIGCSLWLDE